MALQGKDGTWKDASAVYGKSGGNWLYAKSVWANKAGTWTKAWTDCRKHDEGGRDWTAASPVTEYQGSCSTRESRVRTDYTKDGCTGYSRYTSWTASPNCGSVGSSCWTEVTCSYVGQTNVTWNGVTYDQVVDYGYGCIATKPNDNCWYYFWTCGSTQGTTSFCF